MYECVVYVFVVLFGSVIMSSIDSNAQQSQQQQQQSHTKEWIEIVEPNSCVRMFANVITGECVWDEPRGVNGSLCSIIRHDTPHLTQWWELFDTRTHRFYYYCARDKRTVWKRPTSDDAVVVPLAKLQILRHNTCSSAVASHTPRCDAQTQTTTRTQRSQSTQTTSGDTSHIHHNQTQQQHNTSLRNPSLRRYLLSDLQSCHHVTNDATNRTQYRYSSEYDDEYDYADEEEEDDEDDDDYESGTDWDADDEYREDDDSDDIDIDDDSDGNDNTCATTTTTTTTASLKRASAPLSTPSTAVHSSLHHHNNSASQLPQHVLSATTIANNSSNNSAIKSISLTSISLNAKNNATAHDVTDHTSADTRRQSTQQHARPHTPPTTRVSLTLVSKQQASSKSVSNITGHTSSSSPIATPTSGVSVSAGHVVNNTAATSVCSLQRVKSVPPVLRPPHAPPLVQSRVTCSVTPTSTNNHSAFDSFAKENVSRHRKGLIRRQNLRSMLSWSKKSIRKPILLSISSLSTSISNQAIITFKLTQAFMTDRKCNQSEPQIAFDLVTRAATTPQIRDEVLLQIARQTTSNPKIESELLGLQLMAVCLYYWGPSLKLSPHLNAWASQHSNAFSRVIQSRIAVFSRRVQNANTANVHFVRRPHDTNEIEIVLRAVRMQHIGVFGQSLSDGLTFALSSSSSLSLSSAQRLVPWPVQVLTEALLSSKTDDREGVFRCAGDIECVHRLRLAIDTTLESSQMTHVFTQFTDPNTDSTSTQPQQHVADIHVIASTLKLYFRELKEPLIPYAFYWQAINSASDARASCRVVDALPVEHRHACGYLIRFLQVYAADEHVRDTRMDDANLAMVWAPNILRANKNITTAGTTSVSPQTASTGTVLEWTRAEMSFMRTLIQNLDTSFMYGI